MRPSLVTTIVSACVLSLVVTSSAAPPSKAKKWYEGGTLNKKSALDWQKATDEDKLATCADFVATVWEGKDFTPKIQGSVKKFDDFKPYAKELVVFLDAATKKFPDEKQNSQVYTNQKVSALALMGMDKLGWLKDELRGPLR